MTGQRLNPRAIEGDIIANNGYVLTTIDEIPVWAPNSADGVQSIVAGDHVAVDNTDPANPVISAILLIQLVAVIGGEPEFVWDENNEQVLMELIE